MSRVSLIVPIYNAGRFLNETLASIQAQSFKDWECILVNDGSTDDSESICQSFVQRDNRFFLLTLFNNGCADLPIANGTCAATGEFCVIIGHDDYIEPDYLKKLLFRQQQTDADIVCSIVQGCLHELKGYMYQLPEASFDFKSVLSGKEACAFCIGGWHFSANGMLYKTSLNNGILRGHYMNSDEFSTRQIFYKAQKVAFSDARYLYRNHPNSISRMRSPRLWERLIVDEQVERFALSNYSQDSSVKKRAILGRCLNLIHLTAASYLGTDAFNRQQKNTIQGGARFAFSRIDWSTVKEYWPIHGKLLFHSFWWFSVVCTFYVIIRRIRGKEYYYN